MTLLCVLCFTHSHGGKDNGEVVVVVILYTLTGQLHQAGLTTDLGSNLQHTGHVIITWVRSPYNFTVTVWVLNSQHR